MDKNLYQHGGNIHNFGKDVIDFSANIAPFVSTNLKKNISKNFNKILHYPDPQAKNLTREIADYWKIAEENIVVGNGSVELIYLIIWAFKPKTTLIPIPTFSEYEHAAKTIKSQIQFIKLKQKDSFKFHHPEITADILFLCNPNNPTGNLLLNHSFEIEKLPHKLIVVDEAFMDFLPDEKKHTFIWRSQKSKKIVVVRSFTKFFALAGLRIGYMVAHKEIIQTLRQYQIPWSVNVIAQEAARIMLDDKTYINNTKLFIEKERKFLFDEITKIKGLSPFPSVTNFILIKIDDKKINSSTLTKKLIQKSILIRDCSNFRGLNDKFIRIAVQSHKENLRLIDTLRKTL